MSNKNYCEKIIEFSVEEKVVFYIMGLTSHPSYSALPFLALYIAREHGVESVFILLFYLPIQSTEKKRRERGAGDDEKSTKLCQECAISET